MYRFATTYAQGPWPTSLSPGLFRYTLKSTRRILRRVLGNGKKNCLKTKNKIFKRHKQSLSLIFLSIFFFVKIYFCFTKSFWVNCLWWILINRNWDFPVPSTDCFASSLRHLMREISWPCNNYAGYYWFSALIISPTKKKE